MNKLIEVQKQGRQSSALHVLYIITLCLPSVVVILYMILLHNDPTILCMTLRLHHLDRLRLYSRTAYSNPLNSIDGIDGIDGGGGTLRE